MKLDPEKIQIMARLAMLEKERGKEIREVRGSFRSDYIGIPILKNMLRVTLAFLIVLCVWGCCHMNLLLSVAAHQELMGFALIILVVYVVLMLVTLMISFLAGSARYYKNRQTAALYLTLLKKLEGNEES